jgi:hypothetical protein
MKRTDPIGRLAVGVAVTSFVLVAATVAAIGRPDLRAKLGLATVAYAADQLIDVPAGVYDSSPNTLILFARSTCAVCQRLVPFFRRLVDGAEKSGIHVRLVSASPLNPAELAFARALGLGDDDVAPVDVKSLRLQRVPTIVLVDQRGEIHYAREGAVPAGEQGDLLRRMTSLTKAR